MAVGARPCHVRLVASHSLFLSLSLSFCVCVPRCGGCGRGQAGNFVEDDILSNFIRLVAANEELHAYAVAKLYMALHDDVSQEALLHAGVWALGEYGDVLVRNEIVDPEETQMRVTEKDVLDLLESIIRSPYTSDTGREYGLTALIKLSARFPSNAEYAHSLPSRRAAHVSLNGRAPHDHGGAGRYGSRIRSLLESFVHSTNVELQQRASEYLTLFRFDNVRYGVGEKGRATHPTMRDRQRRTTLTSGGRCGQGGVAGAHAGARTARGQPPGASCRYRGASNTQPNRRGRH
jgi:AP-1 complex subunit gamma-1